MNFKTYLQTAEQLQAEKDLLEGQYIVKSKDGIEKRFKTFNDEAKAWAAKESPAGQKKTLDAENKGLEKSVHEGMLTLVWKAVNGPWEWTQLDWSEVVRIMVVPALKKMIKGHNVSPELTRAIKEYDDSNEAPLYKLFDKAVRQQKEGSSFTVWANQMHKYH